MSVARIGKRGVLVLPAAVRKETGLKEGDEILIEVGERGIIHLMKRPNNFVAALKNHHHEIWKGVEPLAYVQEERRSWDK